ncbi:MAG: hypothetical protein EKK41_08200 [Hyphomicrobiales bacterium]|nr:MAG: hypothetical protein EKK41_08200 [Hyphomicrobiales bacterium]
MLGRQAQASGLGGLLDGYAAGLSGFDELMSPSGDLRPHWRTFFELCSGLDASARRSRMERLNTRVRETGIAYDLFADPSSTAQPWRVDFVPLIIAPEEWRFLEQALLQRAQLFDRILADAYGPQSLMIDGSIPHELVFTDPSYLRPCQNQIPSKGFLQFFAMDCARAPDGSWRVIDTHTETPAGIGYAIANRMVHTNVAGDMFSACKALRLAPYFQQVQTALAQRANRVDPVVALLSPGPHHNDFFSHAYLSRYLGLILVEGADLRVAGNRVTLKTLDGLMPVDLVVRCISGAEADPLELDSASFAGTVGMLQAVRQNPDLVTNALGSALAENRGLSVYLPDLSRRLLGEELLIPDGRRWWLGDPKSKAHVLANLDHMVIRPAHENTARPGRAIPGVEPQRLSAKDRALLIERIELGGPGFVAEEKIGFGTTPSLTADGIAAKPYAVRFFVASTAAGFTVMPGGLAMTVDPDATVALSATDAETRDVWVVSDAVVPKPHASLWRPTIESAGRVSHGAQDLPSRAADNLFWLGRYTERADWTMRVLRTSLTRLQEDTGLRQDLGASRIALETLLAKDENGLPAARAATDAQLIEQLAGSLMSSQRISYALPQTLDAIHRIASLTRDRLSVEAWRTLNDFFAGRRWHADAMPVLMGEKVQLLEDGLRVLSAFHGLTHENMTRNFGWSFLDMGRRLERAANLAEILDVIFGRATDPDDETGAMLFVLDLADSFITYRSRYRLAPMMSLVLDLLLVDESNPRSVAYQLAALNREIATLPQSQEGRARIAEQRLALSLLSALQVADVNELAQCGPDGRRSALTALLAHQLHSLPELSDAIGRRYFNLVEKGARWVRARSRTDL